MGSSDTGSESEDDARASTLGPDDYSRNPFGGMSLNASGRAKMGYSNPSSDGGGDSNSGTARGPSQAQIDLANARDRRAAALKKKQKEARTAPAAKMGFCPINWAETAPKRTMVSR